MPSRISLVSNALGETGQVLAVGACKRVASQHAVGEDLGRCRIRVRGRFVADSMVLEQVYGREFHRFRHKTWMQVDRAQRLVQLAQVAGAAENAEQAEM
jgi:hypothetical protein